VTDNEFSNVTIEELEFKVRAFLPSREDSMLTEIIRRIKTEVAWEIAKHEGRAYEIRT
jgi:hypothetical protein